MEIFCSYLGRSLKVAAGETLGDRAQPAPARAHVGCHVLSSTVGRLGGQFATLRASRRVETPRGHIETKALLAL
jgi:hypothetical protein